MKTILNINTNLYNVMIYRNITLFKINDMKIIRMYSIETLSTIPIRIITIISKTLNNILGK